MENVDHPPHYNEHPSGVECIQITEHFPFNPGNAIKYIWRAGKKNDIVEDYKKAIWYLEREIKRVGGDEKIENPIVQAFKAVSEAVNTGNNDGKTF